MTNRVSQQEFPRAKSLWTKFRNSCGVTGKRRTPNTQRPTPNRLKLRGGFELPTNPEWFRGCSTVANNRSRRSDFSLPSVSAQSFVLPSELRSSYLQQFRYSRLDAKLCACDLARVAPSEHRDQQLSRCNVDHSILAGYGPMPYEIARGEIRTPDQGLMSPLLYH